jgi:hypothetical protein
LLLESSCKSFNSVNLEHFQAFITRQFISTFKTFQKSTMIKNTISQLNEAVNGLITADIESFNWTYKAAPEKWSKKEIIGHLIDSAQINLQRFVRCTYEENFKLTYEQVEWVKAGRYQEVDIRDLFGLWEQLNAQIIHVLKKYPADRLQAKCDTGKTAVALHTVEWLAQDYVDHMNHHLKQVYSF